MSNHPLRTFSDLREVAHDLREKLEKRKYIFLFAHNNIGKTRLSMVFKSIGEQNSNYQDTLYFNAFTEDLFRWISDDTDSNQQNVLLASSKSYFFEPLAKFLDDG